MKFPPAEGPHERVGFVMSRNKVVEVENIHDNPAEGFRVSGEDIAKHVGKAKATWHTHPGQSCNLSFEDYQTFLNWPTLRHYIIGTDGVAEYYVEDGEVYRVA